MMTSARACAPESNVRQRLLARRFGKGQFEHADRLPAVGYGRDQPSLVHVQFDVNHLVAEGAPVRASVQRDSLGSLAPLRTRALARSGMSEPD